MTVNNQFSRGNHLVAFSAVTILSFLFSIAGLIQPLHADVFSEVPEAAGYSLVYTLPIPNTANFRTRKAVPYSFNNSASIGLYDRIAYYLELDTGSVQEYVYVSMDAFEPDASKIGLPHDIFNPVNRHTLVNNMNIFSNKAGIVTGTGISTGNVEMWPSNYNQGPGLGSLGASDGSFDWDDGGSGTGVGYGSFQVHNYGAATNEVLFGYNRWGTTGTSDLGIGNRAATDLDWTFAQNANTYTTAKNLQILVREITPPAFSDVATVPAAPENITANVTEASDYRLVYQLPNINNTTFNTVQYTVDKSASIADGSYDRIAYYVELQSTAFGTEFAWVSMDAFNIDASLIGVPNTASHIQQMIVNDMNVVASAGAGVTNATGIQGNIEFWRTNYKTEPTTLIPGGANVHDYDSSRVINGTYGSMQVHNFAAGETIFAYNRWNDGIESDLGIGNQPTGHPDWTYAGNLQPVGAADYTVKNLYVLVRPVPEPSTLALSLLGLVGFNLRRRRRDFGSLFHSRRCSDC